jgi:hypothetical protein
MINTDDLPKETISGGVTGVSGSSEPEGALIMDSITEESSEVVAEVTGEVLPEPGSPQDDPAYKRARSIMEYRLKMEAQKAKETKCCKSKNRPHDRNKVKAAKKARKRNR